MKDIRSMFRLYAYNHGVYDDDTVILRDYFLDSRLSKDTLNDKIMLDIGERYSYWSHTELLKRNIDNWFLAHADNISKLIDSTEYEFDALHLSEEFYEDVDENKNKLRTDNLREAENLTDRTTSNVDSTNVTSDIQEISAYDSADYQPQNRTNSSSTAETDSTTELNRTGTTSNTGTVSNTEDNENRLHHYGNKTNPDYADNVKKERDLALFNVYDWITDSLAEDICLGVY